MARRAAAARKRVGSETPRIWTPPLRPLTRKTTLGFEVIDFAAHVLGIELYPWQKWLLIHALEILEDGSFRFRTIIVLVARQNGKSTLSQVLSLFFLYILGTELILGTAQDLDTAEEVWEGALDLIDETPELSELADKPIRVNGKKTIRLLSGERYKVKAANRRAGRGLTADLILLDELREHTTWDAWGAITKTTRARVNPQVWALSNAGDASSLVLRHLRLKAHEALGDPDGLVQKLTADGPLVDAEGAAELEDLLGDDLDTSLGIFEWSAHPDRDIADRDGWAEANPSLGYMITERTIASELATDPEWVFRTEVLCQWSDGSLTGPFPPGTWEAGTDPESRIDPESRRVWCVDVSNDRGMSYIAVAGFREDGEVHVEVAAQRAGTAWVAEWFAADEKRRLWPVTLQYAGAPASSLAVALEAIEGLTVLPWQGSALGAGTGGFYDSVRAETSDGEKVARVWHRQQPVLDVAAATAVSKPLGETWVWSRSKSPIDVSPLVAATGAWWALTQCAAAVPYRSAYEDAGLEVV